MWHRLEDTNSWIYITDKNNIIVKCKDISEVETVNVNGMAILELSNQFEANTNDGTLLISQRKVTTKVYKDIIPQLNVSIDLQIPVANRNVILDKLMILNSNKSIIKKQFK
jgi:hypothetical protein